MNLKNNLGDLIDEYRGTIRALLSCCTLALAAYVSYLLIDDRLHPLWRELALHLFVALVVAIVLTVVVEINARRQAKKEAQQQQALILRAVWGAILERFMPEVIVRELDGILKGQFVKEDCRYTLTIDRPSPGMADDLCILRRETSFKARNIANKDLQYLLASTIQGEQQDLSVTIGEQACILPRHKALRIERREVELVEGQNLFRNQKGQLRDLRCEVEVARGECVQIYLCGEEYFKTSDENSYVQLTPLIGFEVTIKNQYSERIALRKVQFNHPNWQEFRADEEDTYRYAGGMLPGQGFVVAWREREDYLTTKNE